MYIRKFSRILCGKEKTSHAEVHVHDPSENLPHTHVGSGFQATLLTCSLELIKEDVPDIDLRHNPLIKFKLNLSSVFFFKL